jgi:hydroxyethylthiazole kinase-like uncharacterized protein yjeF
MAQQPALAPVYRSTELRAIEASARDLPLMERAGLAAAEAARKLTGERGGAILVLAGPGNNGGDAFVVARWLRQWFFVPTVVFQGDPSKLPADAAAAHRAYQDSGGTTVAEVPADWRGALIVDGLFGIGLARPLSAEHAATVTAANASGIPILALDVPTGLDADTGVAWGVAIRAAATTTFLALKPGLLTGPDLSSGSVSVHDLGVDTDAAGVKGIAQIVGARHGCRCASSARAQRLQRDLRHARDCGRRPGCRRAAAVRAWPRGRGQVWIGYGARARRWKVRNLS